MPVRAGKGRRLRALVGSKGRVENVVQEELEDAMLLLQQHHHQSNACGAYASSCIASWPSSLSVGLTCWMLHTRMQGHDRGRGQRPRSTEVRGSWGSKSPLNLKWMLVGEGCARCRCA